MNEAHAETEYGMSGALESSKNGVFEQKLAEGYSHEEIQEARVFIAEMRAAGVNPIITVPFRHLDNVLAHGGLATKRGWIPKINVLVGTIGREPYTANDHRAVYEVTNPNITIEPRFTGPDKKFRGVVWFPQGKVLLRDMRRMDAH